MKIAILGANGHLGKAISKEIQSSLPDLYARRDGFRTYESLFEQSYDVLINCMGIANSSVIAQYPLKVAEVTEFSDDLIFRYQCKFPESKAVYISSGAVFGTDRESPITADSVFSVCPNQVGKSYFYGMVKLYSEMKHRLSKNCHIDIRLMAFISEFLPLDVPFLMSDAVNAIRNKQVLKTNPYNIVRDYIHPHDLVKLILLAIEKGENAAYDAYSVSPVTKFEILGLLQKEYGLNYEIAETMTNGTGLKEQYYSINHKAESIGFRPEYTSKETVREIIGKLVTI